MDLESHIKDVFKLNIVSIFKNNESTDGNVYNIKTNNNDYIAKIYDDLNMVNNMIDLYNYLDEMNIPQIIKTSYGNYFSKYMDKYIVIYSFLKGKQLSEFINENNNICPDEIVKLIAKEVRKLHDLTSNNSFNFKTIDFANNLNRKSILHFDLTKENIFINKDKIGFIDFDDAKYGDSVCDVAILLSFFFISKKAGVDNKKINIFLDSYYHESERELKNEELRYIKTYVKCWADYILDGHEFDSSLKESFEFKKKNADSIEMHI